MKNNSSFVDRIATWVSSSFLLKKLRHKRARKIETLSGLDIFTPTHEHPFKILEVGCGTGRDFIRFFKNIDYVELYGKDLVNHNIKQDNFQFIQGDIEELEFPDKYFDLTVSIGVLEHIYPIEKLSRIIKEIDRVSKSYVMIVPSIDTILETHTRSFFWQLRDHNKKRPYSGLPSSGLIFFSDEAWLQFEGFHGAKVLRNYLVFPVVKNSFIYKSYTHARTRENAYFEVDQQIN